jgi:hypothetical protein
LARFQEEIVMATKTVERPAVARTPKQPKTATSVRPSRQRTTSRVDRKPAATRPVEHAVLAADRALRRNSIRLNLPIVGELSLPAGEEVVFIGGIGVLAVVGLLEWPVALLLGVGHTLAMSRNNKVVHAFGEALEEA